MYRLVAFRYRAGAGPAKTMKFSMLASGASEHRLAFADMDQQRRADGLHRRAVGNLAAMITKPRSDRVRHDVLLSAWQRCGLSLDLANVLVTLLCESR